MSRERIIDAVNAVRADASDAYKQAIPNFEYGSDYNTAISTIMQYEPFYNEFITGLVNKIVYTKVVSKSFNNPLAVLKAEGYPLGTDREHVYVNPAGGKQYSMDNGQAGLFERVDPDIKVQYFRRNRQDKFKVTIYRDTLCGANSSWETLDDEVSKMINALYSGNTIAEYNLCKKLTVSAVEAGAMKTQSVDWQYGDATSARELVTDLRTLYGKFKFPSDEYNNYQAYAQSQGLTDPTPAITWVENDNVVLLMPSEVLSDIDVNVLAQAFNMDKASLMGKIIEVDNFDYYSGDSGNYSYGEKNTDGENILAVMADASAFEIYDNLQMAGNFFNPDDLAHHHYLHVWQTYGFNTCADAIAILRP